MLFFFTHKKFWLPILLLLILFIVTEILLRFGWYDRWIKPNSFLGSAIYRMNAISSFGIDQIDWITVGDSRIDWGIDHHAIAELRKEQGLNHVRMSFGSSNFVATQTTIDWSITNMESLDGVMLGLSENAFASLGYLNKQYKVAWPFRDNMDLHNYQPLVPGDHWSKYIYWFAWANYFDDIKAFVNNPLRRFKKYKSISTKHSQDAILNYRKNSQYNLCAHPLKTIDQCINSTQVIDHKKPELDGFKLINRHCSNLTARHRSFNKLPVPRADNQEQMIKNWTSLIMSVLNQDKKFILVLLPEHESHNYIFKPSNAGQITKQILNQLIEHPGFKLIDLRRLFNGKENCKFFADPIHLSNLGIDEVNQAVIKALKQ